MKRVNLFISDTDIILTNPASSNRGRNYYFIANDDKINCKFVWGAWGPMYSIFLRRTFKAIWDGFIKQLLITTESNNSKVRFKDSECRQSALTEHYILDEQRLYEEVDTDKGYPPYFHDDSAEK